MTREEAIKVLNMVEAHGIADEAKRMAIEALSAEPCDKDAISREGLLKSWEELSPRGRTEFDQVIMTIPALPSADRPKGEWIKKQVFNPELDMYVSFIECSVCGYEPYYGGSESKFNYCANCGAKMEGGKE